MKTEYQVILAGIGGQGQIAGGSIIAIAAGNYCNKQATLTSSYGTDTRGTFSKSDIVVSDSQVLFPEATDPDVIVCMHQIAYNRYIVEADGTDTIILYDADLVEPKNANVKQKAIGFTALAEQIGSKKSANMVAVGAIVKLTGVVSVDSVKKTIKDKFNEKVANFNTLAFEAGYNSVE